MPLASPHERWHPSRVRLLPLIAVLLAGCSSTKAPWNSRAQEQARMNAAVDGEQESRGHELLDHDPKKEFNIAQANVTGARAYAAGTANTGEFHFVDRVRTKGFRTGGYETKGAWMGDMKFGTKAAPTKESRYAGVTARTKTYDTREARDADKVAPVRALPDGEREFLNKGRRQADFDRHGPTAQVPASSWDGDLKPMTIEDVRKLLNKN